MISCIGVLLLVGGLTFWLLQKKKAQFQVEQGPNRRIRLPETLGVFEQGGVLIRSQWVYPRSSGTKGPLGAIRVPFSLSDGIFGVLSTVVSRGYWAPKAQSKG